MKEEIKKLFNLINKTEKILESAVLNEIENNKNFKEVIIKTGDSTEIKKLDLNYELKKKNNRSFITIITDNDNQSLNLLKLNNIGSAKQDISPKGTFIKLKKNVIKNLKEEIKINKIS
jgi:signal peptidase I